MPQVVSLWLGLGLFAGSGAEDWRMPVSTARSHQLTFDMGFEIGSGDVETESERTRNLPIICAVYRLSHCEPMCFVY